MKIVTSFVYPPIPLRQFDWCATLDGYEPGEPYGEGATEEDAKLDLLSQLVLCPHCLALCDDDGYSRDDRACFTCKAD